MVSFFLIFTPIWGRFPFWLIFFKPLETTNQNINHRTNHPLAENNLGINSTSLGPLFSGSLPKTTHFWTLRVLVVAGLLSVIHRLFSTWLESSRLLATKAWPPHQRQGEHNNHEVAYFERTDLNVMVRDGLLKEGMYRLKQLQSMKSEIGLTHCGCLEKAGLGEKFPFPGLWLAESVKTIRCSKHSGLNKRDVGWRVSRVQTSRLFSTWQVKSPNVCWIGFLGWLGMPPKSP